jgi:hypothetical protein
MSGMMGPMTANPGMFGGYGMNMNGMNNGMSMGMNYNAGQGMYGGWDGSQNNMWNGGQDKFNPNAFANGMGPQYGPSSSGFGGYNPNGVPQQQQQDFQNGYYGPGFGRGNFRGRGRGFGPGGAGRGHAFAAANYPNANQAAFQSPNSPAVPSDMASQAPEDQDAHQEGPTETSEPPPGQDQPAQDANGDPSGEPAESASAGTQQEPDESQLRGIPTIDSLDQANAQMMPGGPMGMMGHMGPGFGRGGYMRGPYGGRGGFGGPLRHGGNMHGANMQMPRGPGVEGAPAAPRAMREGLPNTSILRQRHFQGPGSARSSVPSMRPSEPPQR